MIKLCAPRFVAACVVSSLLSWNGLIARPDQPGPGKRAKDYVAAPHFLAALTHPSSTHRNVPENFYFLGQLVQTGDADIVKLFKMSKNGTMRRGDAREKEQESFARRAKTVSYARSYCTAGFRAMPNSFAARRAKRVSRRNS